MNSQIKYAVSAAIALSAFAGQNAFAILPSAFDAAEQASNVLRFSGATATDGTTETIMLLSTGGVCTTGTASVFRGTNQRAVLCTGSGTGVAGLDVAYVKESTGGSENGSVAVSSAAPTNLNYLNPFAANFVCTGATGVGSLGSFDPNAVGGPVNNPNVILATSTVMQYDEYTNCSPTSSNNARAGISDVEARLLGIDGGAGVPLNQFQVGFGTPVSLNLYRALQIAQGIPSRTACDSIADGTTSRLAGGDVDGVGELDSQECVPSLDKKTIAQLFSGGIQSWARLTFNGTPLTSFPGVTAPVSNTVFICRRGNESGTQAGTQVYFLNQGCGSGDAFRVPTAGGGSAIAPIVYANGNNATVFAGQSSGDVRNCLDDRDDQNRWAVGVLSLDSTVTGTAALAAGGTARLGNIGGAGGDARDTLGAAGAEVFQREFRFIAINGVNPSLESMGNGGYDFYTENVCTSRGTLAGVEGAIYDRICGVSGISELSRVAATNETLDSQPWGDGGNLLPGNRAGLTNNTLPVSQATIQTNPVNGFVKSRIAAGNNCSTSQPVFPVTDVIPLPFPAGPVLPEDATI